jgi:alpha-amylase
MLDVVANHSIPMNTDIREAGQVNPFNKKEYYHNYCVINWNDRTSMEDCWLGFLADLN